MSFGCEHDRVITLDELAAFDLGEPQRLEDHYRPLTDAEREESQRLLDASWEYHYG